ncbi:MAG: peptidylprolyl isomerase [Oscillospiraceae bacterium]
MKVLKIVSVCICTAILFCGCTPANSAPIEEADIKFVQFNKPIKGQDMAKIRTSYGDITMMLFKKEAPNTVAHFQKLVNEKFYDNKDVFLDEKNQYFISGATDDAGIKGKLLTEKPIECETTPNLWHFSGAVSVVGYEKNKLSKTCVSDSRFMIVSNVEPTTSMIDEMTKYKYPLKVINKYKEVGGMPQLTGRFTVFGHITEGMDVVKKISELKYKGDSHKAENGFKIEKIELFKFDK